MRLRRESIAAFASRTDQFAERTKIQTDSRPYLQPKIPEFDRKALGLQCDLPRAARQRLHMILQDTIDEGDDLRVLRVDRRRKRADARGKERGSGPEGGAAEGAPDEK